MRCKETTRLISAAQERKLALHESVGVKLHLTVCPHCRAFAHNCKQLHSLMKNFARYDQNEPDKP
ncbi:zf-HC2 domain-containing protein [Pasteurellaceae bacterium LIM206]|nr:zf-HC2 domain-containing protein [Pasteurellaceae bacterium LIM206]